MKKVGIGIKSIVLNSDLTDTIGQRFYNAMAPQDAPYPLIVGSIEGVTANATKWHNNLKGVSCNDIFTYRVYVFSFDAEECADLTWRMRTLLDFYRGKPSDASAIFNQIEFVSADEDVIEHDKRDLFAWTMTFTVRVEDGFYEI